MGSIFDLVVIYLLLTTTIKVVLSGQEIDKFCFLECDSHSKIGFRSQYCEECLRMPIRFGRSDRIYNNKLAIIFKSMWKDLKLHRIPTQLLDDNQLRSTGDSLRRDYEEVNALLEEKDMNE